MKIVKKIHKLCMCCMEEHEVWIVHVKEHTTFKDTLVEYTAEYEYCENAEEYTAVGDMISMNDIAMKDSYRKMHHLLTYAQILNMRKKYGISQTDLAKLLGWGEKTITRYESHQVQDMAHDAILRKIDNDPEWFLELLEQGKEKLSEQAYKKYHIAIAKIYERMQDEYLRKSIKAKYIRFDEKINHYGGVKLNLDKVIDIIRYYANSSKVTNLYKVKLMKMLWYADSLSYKKRGHTMTGLVYKAMPMGAVPIGHEMLIDLRGIHYEEEEFSEGTGYHFTKDKDNRYANLTEEDKIILDTIIKIFGKDTKAQIVNRMHKEKAYQETKQGEVIAFEYALELSIDL